MGPLQNSSVQLQQEPPPPDYDDLMSMSTDQIVRRPNNMVRSYDELRLNIDLIVFTRIFYLNLMSIVTYTQEKLCCDALVMSCLVHSVVSIIIIV